MPQHTRTDLSATTATRAPDWSGRCGRLEFFVEELIDMVETYGEQLTDSQRSIVERARTLLAVEP